MLALVAVLAGCGQAREQQQARAEEQRQEAAAPKFPCVTGPGELRPDCTAERAQTDKGWTITLLHPDGHFRRLLVTSDGRGVIAADGAEPARVTPVGRDAIEVAVGGDRYQLPATVGK